MTKPNILHIVSRFPMGIHGVDLRFALQMTRSDFNYEIIQQKIDQNIRIEGSLNDLDQCIFTFQSNMVFRKSTKLTVPQIIIEIHSQLQRYSQGLTLEELSHRINIPDINIPELINDQSRMGFLEQNYEIDNPPIRSLLTVDVSRLVQGKQLPIWMGGSSTRILTVSSILLLLLSALFIF